MANNKYSHEQDCKHDYSISFFNHNHTYAVASLIAGSRFSGLKVASLGARSTGVLPVTSVLFCSLRSRVISWASVNRRRLVPIMVPTSWINQPACLRMVHPVPSAKSPHPAALTSPNHHSSPRSPIRWPPLSPNKACDPNANGQRIPWSILQNYRLKKEKETKRKKAFLLVLKNGACWISSCISIPEYKGRIVIGLLCYFGWLELELLLCWYMQSVAAPREVIFYCTLPFHHPPPPILSLSLSA